MAEASDQSHLIDTGLYRPQLAACFTWSGSGELAIIDTGTNNGAGGSSTHCVLGATPQQVRYLIPTHVHLDRQAAPDG